jgi:acetolactate synthase-1/2/3 large subunit
MKRMMTGRPRPAVLEVPTDVLAAETDVAMLAPESYERPRGDPSKIKEAARLLKESAAPLIWAGGGVIASGATPELVKLAEALQAPVLTTYMGKGAMPEDHPLSLGNWCREPEAREMLQGFLAGRDLALAVGTRFSAMSTAEWTLALPSRLIQVDIDEAELGKNYPMELGIAGDAKAVLGQVLEHLSQRATPPHPSPAEEIASLRAVVRELVLASRAEEIAILQALREALARDAILVNDMAVMSYLASRHFEAYMPRTFLYPLGNGTLGFSFPAALGAKVAHPERQVVSICGDGGFMLSCQELATAVQHGIKLPVVVFNDGGYGVLRETQDAEFGGRRIGVDLVNPDFVKLAESFGAYGLRVESPQGLKAALGLALKADRPTLIEYRRG